ncbi:MAG TPA: cytochrome P450 [Kineosporiaceae bacterium]|nr:cytochrome P450 [Kineosporiaceae bacterium]
MAASRRNARYTPLDVDGPLPLDMIRGIPAMLRNPLGWLEQAVRIHGDLVALPLPRTPVLLVNTPSGARRVLQENHPNYTKQTVQYGALSLVTGAGLLSTDGEPWRRHRRVLQPAFHHGELDQVAAATVIAAMSLRRIWDDVPVGSAVDADAAMMRVMVEVVGRTLFADDLADLGERVVTAVEEALRIVLARARSPLGNGPLARLPSPSRRRLRRSVATLDDVCAQVVDRRRRRGIQPEDNDVLAVLLRASGELSDREIRDELVTLVIAGHETVASSLTWTLHLLAGAPLVQKQLHAELDEVLSSGQGRAPRWSDLPALGYTRAVVDESLRLYPPAWVITRRAIAEDRVDGVIVPPGTLLLISPWLLHRREESWPDPLRFDPTRFLGAGEQSRRREGYLPFGAGPRLCIGRDFALVEATLVLAALLRDRTVAHPTGSAGQAGTTAPIAAPAVDALVTLRPRGGLPLLLSPR